MDHQADEDKHGKNQRERGSEPVHACVTATNSAAAFRRQASSEIRQQEQDNHRNAEAQGEDKPDRVDGGIQNVAIQRIETKPDERRLRKSLEGGAPNHQSEVTRLGFESQ